MICIWSKANSTILYEEKASTIFLSYRRVAEASGGRSASFRRLFFIISYFFRFNLFVLFF